MLYNIPSPSELNASTHAATPCSTVTTGIIISGLTSSEFLVLDHREKASPSLAS